MKSAGFVLDPWPRTNITWCILTILLVIAKGVNSRLGLMDVNVIRTPTVTSYVVGVVITFKPNDTIDHVPVKWYGAVNFTVNNASWKRKCICVNKNVIR